jgi:Putative peptidoglycan binding domain
MKTRLLLAAAAGAVSLLAGAAFADPSPSTSTPASAPAHAASTPSAAATHAASTPAATTASSSATTALYRRAQQKLKDLGMYSGDVDGMRSTAYVHSLEQFQTAHHIRATGRLNSATKRALGI